MAYGGVRRNTTKAIAAPAFNTNAQFGQRSRPAFLFVSFYHRKKGLTNSIAYKLFLTLGLLLFEHQHWLVECGVPVFDIFQEIRDLNMLATEAQDRYTSDIWMVGISC